MTVGDAPLINDVSCGIKNINMGGLQGSQLVGPMTAGICEHGERQMGILEVGLGDVSIFVCIGMDCHEFESLKLLTQILQQSFVTG